VTLVSQLAKSLLQILLLLLVIFEWLVRENSLMILDDEEDFLANNEYSDDFNDNDSSYRMSPDVGHSQNWIPSTDLILEILLMPCYYQKEAWATL
jgi:hypothetical protein